MLRLLLAACLSLSLNAQAAELILIMDDMGYNRALGERALALPGPLNFAFLPHTPHAKRLAQQAHQQDHGIMLHLPMDNQKHLPLGPGGLYANMTKAELQSTIKDNLASIPYVQGVNNHTGSLLTTMEEPMQWTMETVLEQGLFFIDSFTTAQSIAEKSAINAGIPTLKRDIFLDNDTTTAALSTQFNKAIRTAQKQGHAVLIAHPYPATLDFLQQHLPLLSAQNIYLQRADWFLQRPLWRSFDESPHLLTKFQLD